MATVFQFFRFRFHFRALGAVQFPAGKAGNTVRGALGLALWRSAPPAIFTGLFRPAGTGAGPSGLADPPRPFVLRAAHLDGLRVPAGSPFCFDVHTFDPAHPPLIPLRQAFERLAAEGIGPGRGLATLERVEQLDLDDGGQTIEDAAAAPPLGLVLDGGNAPAATAIRLQFVTPTELKSNGEVVERPEFAILFARLRDRIGALATLYGSGPLAVDFHGMGERARTVQLTYAELASRRTERRSARTGQVHSLGGFVGEAEYAGDLGEFLPWLAAARWVGIGRHTVWGQGDVRLAAPRAE